MNATSIASRDTRIIPASKERKAKEITMNPDRSMSVKFGDGSNGVIPADDKLIQDFVVYTMINSDCTEQ